MEDASVVCGCIEKLEPSDPVGEVTEWFDLPVALRKSEVIVVAMERWEWMEALDCARDTR